MLFEDMTRGASREVPGRDEAERCWPSPRPWRRRRTRRSHRRPACRLVQDQKPAAAGRGVAPKKFVAA